MSAAAPANAFSLGQIRRGHTETMNAVIWLSDPRGFTALSDRLPSETVVSILNSYFDCQVPAILRSRWRSSEVHGRRIARCVSDRRICRRRAAGLRARARSRARIPRQRRRRCNIRSATRVERFRFGVALHVGRILYGNIGGGNRLDFTCIGPAVLCRPAWKRPRRRLGQTIVASAEFAGICRGGWSDLGEFPIAGFSKAARVYGLARRDVGGLMPQSA